MKVVSLLDVTKIKNNRVEKFDGFKKYVATGDVSDNKIVSYTNVTFKNRPSRADIQADINTVIFARMKDTNKVLRINECNKDYIYSTGFCVLEPGQNITPQYLEAFLRSPYFQRQKDKLSTGATQKAINNTEIKNIMIPLPPLQIQEKIVEVLDKAQELIDLRKKQIELVDSFIDCIFYDMFGDPVKNPKGWKKEKLGNLCDVYRGSSPRPINKYLGGTIPWIKIGDATEGDNVYMHSTKEHIIEEGVKKSRLVKKGSLIFANCGVSLGFARIITFDGCIHDGWLSFENIDKSLDKLFLLKLLNFYTDYFRKIAPDGTQPNLNTKIMKFFEVIVPPLSLQLEFQKKLNIILSKKQLMQESLDEMEKNYNSLMQRAFRGELFY